MPRLRQAARRLATRSTRPCSASWPSTVSAAPARPRARLTRADYAAWDLLIGMDEENLYNMRRLCGGDPAGKMHLLLEYAHRPGEVADPWYTGDFEATWRDVLDGCRGLLAALEAQK